MTTARREIVEPAVTCWYHCISRGMRGGYLLGEQVGSPDRNLNGLVNYTSRPFRTGNANLSAGVTEIFERLDSNVEIWNDCIR